MNAIEKIEWIRTSLNDSWVHIYCQAQPYPRDEVYNFKVEGRTPSDGDKIELKTKGETLDEAVDTMFDKVKHLVFKFPTFSSDRLIAAE